MTVILYNPNATGGNFDYALKLFSTYKKKVGDSNVKLILPSNARIDQAPGVSKILLSDRPWFSERLYSRLYFLFRSIVNPIIFFFYLLKHKGNVVFNDFDQATSFLWVPLFYLVKRNISFSVVLHDPDRDNYLRSRKLSVKTMEKVMSLMDIAFYHELLPDRPYYRRKQNIFYVAVPHGLYNDILPSAFDAPLFETLRNFKKGGSKLIGAIGNIRAEKNYPLIIRSLKEVPDIQLIIAGQPSNSGVDLGELRSIVKKQCLEDRVMILPKYLDHDELNSVLRFCDAFILYYSKTFYSQSGVLNLLASTEKPVLVSSGETPLRKLVEEFRLGLLAPPDSSEDLSDMLLRFSRSDVPVPDWAGYRSYASWENNVDIAVDAFNKVNA